MNIHENESEFKGRSLKISPVFVSHFAVTRVCLKWLARIVHKKPIGDQKKLLFA
jgi:hypothetical protein